MDEAASGMCFAAIVAVVALYPMLAPLSGTRGGQFLGNPRLELVSDAAEPAAARLLEDYTYVDRNKRLWTAPKGILLNGASIPPELWSVIGGPWSGPYRNASVIHDHFCVTKSRAWLDVHRTFYEAMLSSGVDEGLAKTMYFAVYHFGPRWTATEKTFQRCMGIYGLGAQGPEAERLAKKLAEMGTPIESALNPGYCAGRQMDKAQLTYQNPFDSKFYERAKEVIAKQSLSLTEMEAFSDRETQSVYAGPSVSPPDAQGAWRELYEAMAELRIVPK